MLGILTSDVDILPWQAVVGLLLSAAIFNAEQDIELKTPILLVYSFWFINFYSLFHVEGV